MRSIMPRRRERGAIAVEAGLLIAFVLAPLLLGMVELALFLRDHVAATSLSRSGARVASQEPRRDTFTQDAADALERSASAIPRDAIDFIWIYLDPGTGSPPATCNTDCVVYRWVDGSPGRFAYQSGSWSASSVNACQGDPTAHSVGVLVQATHTWFFGFLGADSDVRANTVMRFEPLYPDHTVPGVESGCKQI